MLVRHHHIWKFEVFKVLEKISDWLKTFKILVPGFTKLQFLEKLIHLVHHLPHRRNAIKLFFERYYHDDFDQKHSTTILAQSTEQQ